MTTDTGNKPEMDQIQKFAFGWAPRSDRQENFRARTVGLQHPGGQEREAPAEPGKSGLSGAIAGPR